MPPATLALVKLPLLSSSIRSTRSSPRSSAASPRVMGVAPSDRLLMGAISSSMAVTKATKPPTVVVFSEPWSRAMEITADSAMAASTWVMALMPA
jgi:hypothetical protein